MIFCSCNAISESDVDRVLVELCARDEPPIPTPGLVYRELGKRMDCCGCAPLAVAVIYERLQALERDGRVCRFRCASIRDKLRVIVNKTGAKTTTVAELLPLAKQA
ncbi:MAG: hypothetical protein JSS20_10020 [Proteobacteria bacterium]|nr:hypothetical protein [Pseudomonadota bacterium]